jgi:hypothetical protein
MTKKQQLQHTLAVFLWNAAGTISMDEAHKKVEELWLSMSEWETVQNLTKDNHESQTS